ncbi:alpha/beta hydrolase [Streptomyces smaragdinus]|nr:alpha/beta hydrolase [Streptomyces smaragdinus]
MHQSTSEVTAAHGSWLALSKTCGGQQEVHRGQVTGPLREMGWKGEAAYAGMARMDRTESELGVAGSQALAISVVLDNLRLGMETAKRNLHAAVKDAEADGCYTVTADGTVTARPLTQAERHDPDVTRRVTRVRAEHQARIDAAVQQADRAGKEAATLLRRFVPARLTDPGDAQADARLVLQSDQGMCPVDNGLPDGSDPKASAAWWQGLSQDDRAMYLAAYPEDVGRLNGLPVTVRDDANRAVLDTWIASRTARGESPSTGTLHNLLALRDRMDVADAGPARYRIHLIALDPSRDGKAIASVGDPDTVEHTSVFVPGTGADLGDMSGSLSRTDDIVRASEAYGGEGNVAGVIWLGYDAPDEIVPDAADQKYARDAGPALREFFGGMEASHQGGERHITAVGHSYGSTVVGAGAMDGGGLPGVDDIIVAGSPGMLVWGASELNVPAGHVWAMEAEKDPVPDLGQIFLSPFGHTPDDRNFGANMLVTDTTGHNDYWKQGTHSLDNQARVIGGRGQTAATQWRAG